VLKLKLTVYKRVSLFCLDVADVCRCVSPADRFSGVPPALVLVQRVFCGLVGVFVFLVFRRSVVSCM
jgi:hypothetical protein